MASDRIALDDIYTGENPEWNLLFQTAGGSTIDITNYTIWASFKPNYDDADGASGVILKTVTTHQDPTNGHSIVQLTTTDTNSMEPKAYYYAFKYKDGNNNIRYIPQDTDRVEVKTGIIIAE